MSSDTRMARAMEIAAEVMKHTNMPNAFLDPQLILAIADTFAPHLPPDPPSDVRKCPHCGKDVE